MNNDCLFCIFELLNINDIHTLSLVCKQFNMTTNNELIWKSLFNDKFNINIYTDYKKGYNEFSILDNFLMGAHLRVNDCYHLKMLQVRNIRLQPIPKEIGRLTPLRTLVLTDCGLEFIPSEIGLLTQLEDLNLSSN